MLRRVLIIDGEFIVDVSKQKKEGENLRSFF